MVVCYQEGTQLRHTVGVSDRMPYQALRRKTDNGFRQDHCLSSFAINGFHNVRRVDHRIKSDLRVQHSFIILFNLCRLNI